jgi:predicted thioesterase
MKSHPKIGTAGELPFVVEQKHCIDFATDGMPAVLSTPNLIGLLEDGSLDRPHPGPLPQERESLSNPPRLSMLYQVSPRPVLLAGRMRIGDRVRFTSRRKKFPPLLGGEGRGEGELSQHLPESRKRTGIRNQNAVQIQIRLAMKSHPKIGAAGELPFVVEQQHCIDFATDGMPAVLSTPQLIGLLERIFKVFKTRFSEAKKLLCRSNDNIEGSF